MVTHPWTVVLAAGAGRRLHSVTGGVPKQFWRLPGGESLLEQTMTRFDSIAPRTRTVVIVDRGHGEYVEEVERRSSLGTVVVQPEDRGTAAGVLLALTPVLESRPDAVVILTPSDHGIGDAIGFERHVAHAVERVRIHDDIVLFGAAPDAALQDYGWMLLAGDDSNRAFSRVHSFVEKPDRQSAMHLLSQGAVWNTMMLVAKAATLCRLYESLLPDLAALMLPVVKLPPSKRAGYLASVYPHIPRYDFSRDVLGRATRLRASVLPASLGWTDLGTPERLNEWRSRRGSKRVPPARLAAAQVA